MGPPDGWPLDELFVGVGTLRTARELFRQDGERGWGPARAWDLALWSGVTPQGAANSLERLRRLELVRVCSPGRPGCAPTFEVHREHPLATPLAQLFRTERAMVRPQIARAVRNAGRRGRRGEPT